MSDGPSVGELAGTGSRAPIVWAAGADPRVVTFWGARWAEQTGVAAREATGRRWLVAVHPDDRGRCEAARGAATERGEAFAVEYRLRTADGGYARVVDRGEPQAGEDGRVRGWFGSLTEVERSRAPEGLFRATVDALIECCGVFAAVRDAGGAIVDFRIEYLNPAACRNNGRALAEQVGRGLLELLPAHRDSGLFEAYRRVVETGEPLDREQVFYADEYPGEWKARWFDIRAARLGDGFVATWHEVTARRGAEEALRRMKERLRRFADAGVIGINFADVHGGIRYANDEYLRIVGHSREAFEAGKIGWRELTPPEWLAADERSIAEARERGWCTPYEKQYVRPDGTRVWVLIGYSLIDWPERGEESIAFVLDLTARKQAERALRDRVEELTTVMEVLPIPVMVAHDPECQRITGNPAAHAMFAVPLGANLSKTPGPEDPPARYAVLRDGRPVPGDTLPMQRAAASGRAVTAEEYELRFADGRSVHLVSHAAPLFTPAGEVRGCLGAFVDVTAQKELAEALRRSGEEFRLITESIPQMVWSALPDRSTEYCNQRFLDYLGLSLEEVRGFAWASSLHPDDAAAAAAWEQAYAQGRPYEVEFRIRRAADGEYRWHLGRALPLRAADGTIVRWYGTCTDIHDRRVMEAALRESEERFRRAIAASPHPIMIHAEDGTVVGINQTWEELTGYPAAALRTTADWAERAYGPRKDEMMAQARELYARGGTSGGSEWTITTASGASRTWEFRSAPLGRDPAGRLLVITIGVDVTDRKLLDEQLRAVDRRKDDFLSQLAHELRNPLAPVRNALEILRLSPTPDTVTRVAGLMDRQLRQIVGLVDDLHDIARIRAGKLQLQPGPVDLAAAVRSALEACEPARRGHALTVTLPDEPLTLLADEMRVVQVISNLLTNAFRYTPAGGTVTVTARREGDRAVLQVRDSGIGIPAEALGRVFELFTQVHVEEARTSGGLGIGLALVKTVVELHHGEVTASSEGPGRGSTFTVRLPLAPAPTATLAVVVVDDNADAADSLVALLELSGHQAWAAYDGPAGLAAIASYRPDLVLLDIGLPGMDGHAVARAARERCEGDLYIAALSGWGREEDRQRSREAGFDAHLVKPVGVEDLAALLAEVTARKRR